MFDITLLTDSRYIKPLKVDNYIQNVLNEDLFVEKALLERGLSVTRIAWDDKDFTWKDTKFAVFRSTWDYFNRIKEFKNWMMFASTQTNFINPVQLIQWNLDKHYLQNLALRNVKIPETEFLEPGSEISINNIMQDRGWNEVVLKPAIAAAGRHTYRVNSSNLSQHEAIFNRLIQDETMLIQEFHSSVLTGGEVALIYFGGDFSHAVLKKAKAGEFRVQDDFGGSVHRYDPTEEELELGKKAINSCEFLPIYGRVDLIKNSQGEPMVGELELIEPELWFRLFPESVNNFADAIVNYVA